MNKKIVFFDIDGTLITDALGQRFYLPPSTRRALELLRQRGHLPAIASGRQELFISTYFPGMFQSYIASNGAYVVCEGRPILEENFTEAQVRDFMAYFDPFGCQYDFVGNRNGWARNVPAHMVDELNASYGLPDYLITQWEPGQVRANMLDFVFEDRAMYERCKPAFQGDMVLNVFPGREGTLVADLSFKGKDKSRGVRLFLEHLGAGPEDAVAFGDGLNDVGMLQTVGTGVAMGNAVEAAKEAADYVTSPILEDGVYAGLAHLGLI